ncbi:dynein regulatory complex subunit 5-like [Haliotis rufescens]|uniref:dynein regulatory complex subunit 5-like n=1 Tax=Haliotis rufescens TaxID=6454 RepID=UPI001EAF985A|nr:dynein regulatory complex subunit 5-like [Haliotis rufescens]
MAEPPLTEQTQQSEGGDKQSSPADEDAKSTKSGPKSQGGSKPTSRAGSAGSHKSGKSQGSKRGREFVQTPTGSAKDNPAADWRNMRRIIAEDPEWSLATVPLLTELSVKHIVENFENNSEILTDLLPKHQNKVLEKISPSLPLKVTANLVQDEDYWKRCCKARWEICDVSAYGESWKRMYFEKHLQEIIEHFVPETTDPTKLTETLALSANYIKKIDINQLLPPVREAPKGPDFDEASDAGSDIGEEPECDHFNFTPVLKALPNLEELHLTYGVKDCGMNFEWNLFQFTARDCLQLAECVAKCKTLKVFKLHRSKVDEDKVRVLISHILDHPSLIELDLSHNLIGDRGARAVGKFLNNHSQLVRLNLCDNQIKAAGAQAIAHALTKNTTLQFLNLRLNRLGDDGGQAICRSLLKNTTLREVNVGSNDMAEPTAAILSQVVMQNNTVKSIDLSCNRLGPDGGKQLQEGMEENTTITQMDLRLTECGQESEYCINQILHRNQEQEREANIRDMEAHTPKMKKIAQPQAAHRYKSSAIIRVA